MTENVQYNSLKCAYFEEYPFFKKMFSETFKIKF